MVLDTQDDTTVAKRDRVTNVSVVILCRVCQALLMGAVALFLPLIRRDLGLSFTQGGALSALTILTYALMQVPAGFMTDRFGPKRLFFMGVLGTTVLFFTFGLVINYFCSHFFYPDNLEVLLPLTIYQAAFFLSPCF